jgi:hypothetical protein
MESANSIKNFMKIIWYVSTVPKCITVLNRIDSASVLSCVNAVLLKSAGSCEFKNKTPILARQQPQLQVRLNQAELNLRTFGITKAAIAIHGEGQKSYKFRKRSAD